MSLRECNQSLMRSLSFIIFSGHYFLWSHTCHVANSYMHLLFLFRECNQSLMRSLPFNIFSGHYLMSLTVNECLTPAFTKDLSEALDVLVKDGICTWVEKEKDDGAGNTYWMLKKC